MLVVSFNGYDTGEQVRKAIEVVNSWYLQDDTITQLRSLVSEVKRWLEQNKQKTNKRGEPQSGEPWIGIDQFDLTSDLDRLDLRRSALRDLIWGNGMRRLLNMMIESGLFKEEPYDLIEDATDFAPKALHEDLLGYKLSPTRVNKALSVRELMDRYGFSEGTNSTKMRNTLVRMAAFGLWKVEVDDKDHFAIRLGPVAEMFHKQVFSPVRKAFEPRINGKEGRQ
jgi:hypothetical protein